MFMASSAAWAWRVRLARRGPQLASTRDDSRPDVASVASILAVTGTRSASRLSCPPETSETHGPLTFGGTESSWMASLMTGDGTPR